MKYSIRDFELELINEPTQAHVEAWERAARALRNEEAKPLFAEIMDALKTISLTSSNLPTLISVFSVVSQTLQRAIKVVESNETLTLSSNRATMVKAAIVSGWIISPALTNEQVDKMRPWLVTWIAEKVGALYLESTEIPKN